MTTKVCTKCGRELPLNEFGIDNNAKGNLTYWCKECLHVMRLNKSKAPKSRIKIKGTVYFKRCSKCGIVMSVKHFGKHNNTEHGYSPACIKCNKLSSTKNYKLCRTGIKINPKFKTCCKCNKLKSIKSFSKHNKSYCEECLKVTRKEIYKNYCINHYGRAPVERGNPEKLKAKDWDKVRGDRDRRLLTDRYIKGLIIASWGIHSNIISSEMIDLKRAIIVSKRELKQYKTI